MQGKAWELISAMRKQDQQFAAWRKKDEPEKPTEAGCRNRGGLQPSRVLAMPGRAAPRAA